MKTLTFVGRHVFINDKATGYTVDLDHYNISDDYRAEVNQNINLLIEGRL